MVKREAYNIISIPNTKPYIDYPADFPRMGRLYLELIENKDKVKPELVNTDYTPKVPAENFEAFFQRKKEGQNEWSKKYLEKPKDNNIKLDKEETSGEGIKNIADDLIGEGRNKRDYEEKSYESRDRNYNRREHKGKNGREYDREDIGKRSHENIDRDYDKGENRRGDKNMNKEWKKVSGYRDESRDSREDSYRGRSDDRRYNDGRYDRRRDDRRGDYSSDYSREGSDYSRDRRGYRESSSENGDFLTDKLKSLLRDDNYSKEKYGNRPREDDYKGREDKYSVKRENDNRPDLPPSLAQLEKDGEYNHQKSLPNYSYGNLTDKELDNRKRELLFKFEILKKQYKDAVIPEFTQHSNIDTMEKTYESTVRSLHVDSDVEKWKKWLYYSFMAIEFVFSSIFNFEMAGYTQQQMLSMNDYEKCLIELGEKSYSPVGSSWPVEIRLLFAIMLNTGLFILGKMFMKKNGFSMNYKAEGVNLGKPKRKMKGPSVLPEDLPEVE